MDVGVGNSQLFHGRSSRGEGNTLTSYAYERPQKPIITGFRQYSYPVAAIFDSMLQSTCCRAFYYKHFL